MLLRQIQYFQTVVQCRNFTEAAAQCNISQSAISQQIQALEAELGAKLLDRDNRKFALTPAGEYFYKHSLLITADIEKLRNETARIASGKNAHFRIGYPRSYDGMELQRAVASFSPAHPGLIPDLVPGSHEALYTMIQSDEVDIIVNDTRRAYSPLYVNYELAHRPCMIELSASHPLAYGADGKRAQSVQTAELSSQTCVVITEDAFAESDENYFRTMLGIGREFITVPSIEEARLLVAADRGFLALGCSSSRVVSTPQSIRLPLYNGDEQVTFSYCAFWKKERNTADAVSFAETMKKEFTAVQN